jgi:hypothetical protein
MIGHYRADLPVLSAVKGNIYIRGATGLNCSLFNHVSISGTLDCEGTAVPLSTPTTTGSTSTVTSATSTGLSTAAKGGIGGGVAAGALFIIALAVWYSWQKRRSSSTSPDKDPEHKKTDGKIAAAELPLGRHHERSELQASPNQVSELTGDQEYRPRSPIRSLPVTAPSFTPGDSEQMRGARLSSPAELEWPRDSDLCSSTAS